MCRVVLLAYAAQSSFAWNTHVPRAHWVDVFLFLASNRVGIKRGPPLDPKVHVGAPVKKLRLGCAPRSQRLLVSMMTATVDMPPVLAVLKPTAPW